MATFAQAYQYAKANPNSDFAKELEAGIKSGAFNAPAKQEGFDLAPFNTPGAQPTQPTEDKPSFVSDVAVGAVKGIGSTLKGLGELGTKIAAPVLSAATGVPKEQFGAKIYQPGTPEAAQAEATLTATTPGQKVGKFVEQAAEFLIPASKVSKATKGSKLLTKIGARGATSGTVATAQQGEIGSGTAIAAGTEAVFPVVGAGLKFGAPIFGRLFKGIGSGLSGVSSESLETIARNPDEAVKVSQQIKELGGDAILEKNAKTIVNGISKIRKEASNAYRKGLEELSTTDIKPENISKEVANALSENKIVVKKTGFDLGQSDILDPAIKKKAGTLINLVNDAKDLSGAGVRKLMDVIENSRFKSAPDGDRQAFNALADDIKQSLRKAISSSTNKLDEINKAYTGDLQIAENAERIFGDVDFKNISEVSKAALKLEQLFAQKGLNPKEINNFLERIGVSPEDFRTSESVRQISEKAVGANTTGLTLAELTQQFTSAVVTPNMVKNLAVATGRTEQQIGKVIPVLEKLDPAARATTIEVLLKLFSNE